MGLRTDSRGVEYVSTANFRVCFAWQNNLAEVLDLLFEHSEKELKPCYYWIDLFCENYHDQKYQTDHPERWLRQTVVPEIGLVGHTIVVLPDLTNPLPIRRSWCVLEIAVAIRKNTKLSFLSKAEDNERLTYALIDCNGGFDEIFRGFSFRLDKMENSAVHYSKVIYKYLEKLKFEVVGEWILEKVKNWVIAICKFFNT